MSRISGDTNPCLKEQEQTFKCFNDNNYDKEKCNLQIQNYNTCKQFWGSVQSERRIQGVKPYLPVPGEREQIKKDFFEKLKK